MLETTNYNLNKIELTDSPPDITVINPNWDAIDAEMKSLRELNNSLVADYIRSPGYGVTTGSANIYTLTLNPELAAYTAGVCVAVKINVANTGASTININGLGAKSIKDSKGNALTSGKLALNGVYTFRYDGTNFILQGEGGEYGTATASDVLSGKTIGTDNGLIQGTIPSKAAATFTPSTIAQTIVAGQYLSGIQTIAGDVDLISANIKAGANIFGVAGNTNVVDTSAGTAVAADILATKVAFVDGVQISGSMVNRGAATLTPGASAVAIPAGYHNGSGVVSGVTNLVEENIKNGVNVGGVVGTFSDAGVVTASDTLQGNMGTNLIDINSLTYVEMSRFIVYGKGTIRIKFNAQKTGVSGTGYVQIYVNGVAVGTEIVISSTTYTYYAQDITLSAGINTVSYYVKTTNASYPARFSGSVSGVYYTACEATVLRNDY